MTGDADAWLEIDLGALAHNLAALRAGTEGLTLLASVKGNGYGHGAVVTATSMRNRGIEAFMVATVAEGRALREAGIDGRIICFSGQTPLALEAFELGITLSVCSAREADALNRIVSSPTRVWVEVDAGFHRYGVAIEDFEGLIARIEELPSLALDGVYTHLPFTDKQGRDWAEACLDEFDRTVQAVRARGISIPIVQALSSAGVIAGLRAGHSNAVCVGHALYGLRTFTGESPVRFALQPVLRSLRARVNFVSVREQVATLPIGLAQGFRIDLARGGSVLLGGRRAPIVRVSTANMTVDTSTCEAIEIRDEAVLVGAQGALNTTLEEFATWSGATPLECLLAWNERLSCVPVEAAGFSAAESSGTSEASLSH